MQNDTLQDSLIHSEKNNSQNSLNFQESIHQQTFEAGTNNQQYIDGSLKYKIQPDIQGQCILKSIHPISRNNLKYSLYILLSFVLLGIPVLITFWYPKLKMKFYYQTCSLHDATNLYIINNDDQPTYPVKQLGLHCLKMNQCQSVFSFTNRYLKYLIRNYQVTAASYQFFDDFQQIKQKCSTGLTTQKAQLLRKSYGLGAMLIQRKSIPKLFISEIMRPLYLFIIMSCILWLYEAYYYYTIMIFVTAVGGVITSLYETYKLNKKIHQMAYYQTNLNYLRNNVMVCDSSKYIVPGDIVFLKDTIKIPFDGVLLQGSALCNQCSITGQSVPVIKKYQDVKKLSKLKSSYLYQGSTLIQVNAKQKFKTSLHNFEQYRQQYGLPVLVIRTNFTTLKGQLIRIISFPQQKQNIFERQSVKFLFFLFFLSFGSYCILVVRLWDYASKWDLFVKLLDLITVTVPPGLPVSMTFGIIFAIDKMKKKMIFCTSPNKIVTGGMTDMICFDKTGTLTQDYMDFYCLAPTSAKKQEFIQPILQENDCQVMLKENGQLKWALNNMACNHNIVKIQQTGEYVGDPMEVKMLEFGGFVLQPVHHIQKQGQQKQNKQGIIQDDLYVRQKFMTTRGHQGGIIRNFQFDSELFRMSTIAISNLTGQNNYYLYAKGSPQQMLDIMDPNTVPKNFKQVLKLYTARGYRVLAIGSTKIDKNNLKADRSQLQKNLQFDGFEVFENKLKPQTTSALNQLRNAQIPCVMITGDNALTASSIAYKCGISDQDKKTYICTIDSQKNNCYQLQKFRDDFHVNSSESQIIQCKHISEILKKIDEQNAQLCLTGDGFNQIYGGSYEQLGQEKKQLFWRVTVFARAKPNDKTKIVSMYQHFGKIVAMCGDGANDCGALKQASIGLSLSQAQASISAPFTSQVTNISSMVQLIKQCRAGLATNFSLFNIMALYSLIQYNTVLICQYYFAFPSDFSYFYWDAACNFVFFITFGYTGTTKTLSKHAPSQSLFTISNISQIMIAFIIQLIGQFLMLYALSDIYAQQIGYTPDTTFNQFIENDGQFVLDSFEGNILFLFTNYIYISTLLAFSISKPWRDGFYRNLPLMVVFVVVMAYTVMITVWEDSRWEMFEIKHMSYQPMNLYVLYVGLGLSVVIYFLQKSVLEPGFFKLRERYPGKKYL